MKILDATFPIDYLDGIDATREYLQARDSEVFPDARYQDSIVTMNAVSNFGEIPPGELPGIVLPFGDAIPA